MFDIEDDFFAFSSQIEVAVAPGMEVGGSSQGLSRSAGLAFACVVHEQGGAVVFSLEIAQEAQEGCDFAGGVFIDAVEAYEGVEDEEAGLEVTDGIVEQVAVWL